MKKIFAILFVSMCCTMTYAQHPVQQGRSGRSAKPEQAQKKHAFFLGLKGGGTFSTMTQPEECKLYDGSGIAFSAGLAAKVRFNPASPNAPAGTGLVGAGLELKYKVNNVKTIGTNETGKVNANMTLGYFEVPVFVQLYPFYKSDAMNTFYIEAGPTFAGIMSRKPKSLTVDGLTGNQSSVTYNIDANGSKLKGMDVRVMAGVGYDFPIKNENGEATNLIGINARYYLGTSKLAGNFASKMNSLEVSLSWMFSLGKL